MMEKMSVLLLENGIENDVICFPNFELIHNSRNTFICLICRISSWRNSIRPYRLRKIFVLFFNNVLMKKLFKSYDKIDFHSYLRDNLFWSKACVKWSVKYDITIWGSEVLRASDEELKDLEWGYANANCIRGVDKILNRLSLVYDGKYDGKMIKTYFGNTNFELFDSMTNTQVEKIAQNLFIKKPDKLTVTCGYNGLREQQHTIIIDAIRKLPSEIKEKMHLVFPMTYGLNAEYRKELNILLESAGVSYTVLDRFLSTEELASLRLASDIIINTQTTDAFCAAIQDHLYCGGVLIIADWLEYPQYDDKEVFYFKASLETLSDTIMKSVVHFEEIKEKTKENKCKLRQLTSWNVAIGRWIDAMKA